MRTQVVCLNLHLASAGHCLVAGLGVSVNCILHAECETQESLGALTRARSLGSGAQGLGFSLHIPQPSLGSGWWNGPKQWLRFLGSSSLLSTAVWGHPVRRAKSRAAYSLPLCSS